MTATTWTRLFTLLACAAMAGCGDSEDAREVREGMQVAWETVRGEPSEAKLRAPVPFMGGGVSFDHPAPLRTAYERSAEGHVWTFAYGVFELELWSNDGTLDAEGYLRNIADALVEDHGGKVREPLADGRTVAVCGESRVSSVMALNLMGDVLRYEAIDLPPDHRGRGRILMLFDGIGVKQASRTAVATTDMVFSTLRCQPAPAHRSDPDEATA